MEDKAVIDDYFHQKRYEQADTTFMTLFAWQRPYEIQWAEENNVMYIRSGRGQKQFWLPPFVRKGGNFLKGLECMHEWFEAHQHPFLMKGVVPDVVQYIQEICPDQYHIEPDRDNYEYVYLTQDLINLSGKKFRQKKNNLNHFRNQYMDYEYIPITENLFSACLEAEQTWYDEHSENGVELDKERHALETVFENWNMLQPTGGAICVFNKVVAFSIGEMLNDDTAIIHFEKSDPSMRGLYQAINYEFVRHAWSHTTYINREEDMGIPGLRKSKESYNPVRFVEKYDVTLVEK